MCWNNEPQLWRQKCAWEGAPIIKVEIKELTKKIAQEWTSIKIVEVNKLIEEDASGWTPNGDKD